MNPATLVRPLFDGPIDIVGDIHGEIEALHDLLLHLGYPDNGTHPQGRRLVFLGDLIDRGPDSPAVASLVARFVDTGRAQCIIGNHELNILRGERKDGNDWFYPEDKVLAGYEKVVPQKLADARTKAEAIDLFKRLPLALEREDMRLVHACWDQSFIDLLRAETSVEEVYGRYRDRIEADLGRRGVTDKLQMGLAHQNENPVKLVTSGPEAAATKPFFAGGKLRNAARVRWWENYKRMPFCVFGHYWRIRLSDDMDGDHVFDDGKRYATLGNGQAMCIDYSVGRRCKERQGPGFDGRFQTRLASLRLPEKNLVFDDGGSIRLA